MTRRLLNLLTALALLLFVAVCVLWVRSYWRVISLTYFRPWSNGSASVDTTMAVAVSQGAFYVRRFRFDRWPSGQSAPPTEVPAEGPGAWSLWIRRQPDQQFGSARWDRAFAGFGLHEDQTPRVSNPSQSYSWAHRITTVRVPGWAVAALTIAAPAMRAARKLATLRRERRRLTAGLCSHCGYEVRATRGRCPECGTAAARAAA